MKDLEKEEKKEVIRYDKNPFVENMVVPVRGQRIKLTKLGKSDEVELVNTHTGESFGTHITTFKKVDTEQFLKLFVANTALTFHLKPAGIKAFNVLVWSISQTGISKDLVPLDKYILDDFLDAHIDDKPPIKLSQQTFWRGLAELEQAKIIAKNIRLGWYYINPNFCFSGDRIAFTTVIERNKEEENKPNNNIEDKNNGLPA